MLSSREDRGEIQNIATDLPLCLTNSPHSLQWRNKKFSTCLTLPRISFLSATTFPNHSPAFQRFPYFFFKTKCKEKTNFLSSKEIFYVWHLTICTCFFLWLTSSCIIVSKDYRANSSRPNGQFYIDTPLSF